MSGASGLTALGERCPEWKPWLVVVAEVLGELSSERWDAAVPPAPHAGGARAPLLEGAVIRLDPRSVESFLGHIARTAAASGAPRLKDLHAAAGSCDAIGVFIAALEADTATLARIASGSGAPHEPFSAVAALLPLPFLHACSRRWSAAIPRDWTCGYCPVCAAWPAFAEDCGIERTRYLRCMRCGSRWHLPCLSCAHCNGTDHELLGALVAQGGETGVRIEVCKRCNGYLKVFTRLRPCAAPDVIVEDLASVELDIAAAARGYRRPQSPPVALAVSAAPTLAAAATLLPGGEGAPAQAR